MFILDHDKGLQEANAVLSKKCLCAYCCKHIKGNLKDKFSKKASLLVFFWKAARARLLSGFNYYIGKIAAINLAAAEYLQAIKLKLWAVAYFPRT